MKGEMKGLNLCKPSFQVQVSEISTDFQATPQDRLRNGNSNEGPDMIYRRLLLTQSKAKREARILMASRGPAIWILFTRIS